MRLTIVVLVTACSPSLTRTADQTNVDSPQVVLPLKKVRLYASGVGYFEREGRMAAGTAGLPVPAGHLDDALKSLVVLSASQGVGSVSFASRLSPAVARARAGLPADQESPLSYDKLLVALRGERVALTYVETSATAEAQHVEGQVVDVVAVQPDHPSYDHGLPHQVLARDETLTAEQERLQVLILTERGQVLRLDSAQLHSVQPLDEFVAKRLQAALSARLATRSNQRQALHLTGSGNKPVTLAYMAEAPTWRASYRLLIDGSTTSRSRLHAWALVHNDTDEPWHDVRLELVHGRPSSFLFPMAAPRYERRELQTPELELSSVPQLSTTTPDAMWGDFSEYDGETLGRVGSLGFGGLGSGEGFGEGHGALAGSHRTSASKVQRKTTRAESDLLWVGDLAERAGVATTSRQTQPVHRVAGTISLAPQHSAMVPFMDTGVSASPLVWFEGFDADAQRAVGVCNTTAHTLPAGPLSVYASGGFLGEAMLATLKPGARQFAQVGDEPDVTISARRPTTERAVQHVDFRDGQLRTHAIQSTTRRLTFHNQSATGRQAYVVLDVVRNARVEGCESVDFETTSNRAFAVFQVAPGQGHERTLVTHEAILESESTETLQRDELMALQSLALPDTERAILKLAEPALAALDSARRAKSELELDVQAVEAELVRLREHLTALGKSDSGVAASGLVGRILEREDHLAGLHANQRARTRELEDRQAALDAIFVRLEGFREGLLAQRKQAREAER
jgi:hypothetical protein